MSNLRSGDPVCSVERGEGKVIQKTREEGSCLYLIEWEKGPIKWHTAVDALNFQLAWAERGK